MLQQAYVYTNVTQLAQRETFAISQNRSGRSQCPLHFPALSSFVWKADDSWDVPCPARQISANQICAAFSVERANAEERIMSMEGWMISYAVAVGLTVVLLLAYLVRQNRKPDIPTVLTIYKAYPDEDSMSEASACLMVPMHQYNSNENYHALESDSSSEDLLRYNALGSRKDSAAHPPKG
jgi:hypothetical protein